MPQTLTSKLLTADFADMATDFPCTVSFTEPDSGLTEVKSGTYGQMDESPLLADAGLLSAYTVSVWVPSSGWTTKPKSTRLVTVNVTNPQTGVVTSVTHQVLRIGQDDGVAMRLILGDRNA